MSFTFIYESENKKLKSFEKRDDLVLKEVRFQKKIPKVKIGKIGRDYRHLSTLIIPIPNSEVNFYYNSCEVKISQNGLLKINGKTKEIVSECIDFFEKIILNNLVTNELGLKVKVNEFIEEEIESMFDKED